jgi:GNAT superfamily N-acetyltransferase
MATIRRCRDAEVPTIQGIINAAAQVYRSAIPPDLWHEPYMPLEDLERDIAAGVEFWGYEDDGTLIGVMGIQRVKDADLIRHAYVLPSRQREGIGAKLIAHLQDRTTRQILVGTWADALWAISFYERHGYVRAAPDQVPALLQRYWTIGARHAEASVVLAKPALRRALDD